MIAWIRKRREARRQRDAERRRQEAIDTLAWVTDLTQHDGETRDEFAVRLRIVLRDGPSS